jgi:hypothetical protein
MMNNDIGLHKIGNPNKEAGAVSLHFYTPPFKTCKVWSSTGVGSLNASETGNIGYFSVKGLRTPYLEGTPGPHAQLLCELLYHYHYQQNKANMRGVDYEI